MNDLEKRIFELINEASEEDTPSTETVDVEQTTDTNQETGTEDRSDVEEETTFTAESFDDFLKKTDTKVKITKVSTEPSPIFGPQDRKNHNKYKVTVSNKNGSVWFFFWDSIFNTENGKTPTESDVLSCFGLDANMVNDGSSLEDFKANCGYDNTDNSLAQKAFDGCRKMLQRAKKLFTEEELNEFFRLAGEY